MSELFRQQMQEFQFALSTQILLMNYDLTTDLRQETLAESNKTFLAISALEANLASQVSGVVPDAMQNVDSRITRLEESFQNRLKHLEALISSSSQSRQSAVVTDCSRLEPLGSCKFDLEATNISRSSPAQGLDPWTASVPRDIAIALENSVDSTPQNPFLNFECHCPAITPGSHMNTCVYSFREQKRRALVGQIKVFHYILKYKIQVQFSRHAFPGDFEIYPNFTVRATRKSSPAFELLSATASEQFDLSPSSVEALSRELQSCLLGIRHTFFDRKAWPIDINSKGWNLIHLACFKYCPRLRDETAFIFVQFIKQLVDMGVPVNGDSTTSLYLILDRFNSFEIIHGGFNLKKPRDYIQRTFGGWCGASKRNHETSI
ncbi:hypothetical protein EDB81DRAFT_774688 [Dactylonectria macrodidyma]|uniref:Uncharacterized protein n=1 Tax=Dactylonectria macrodidyma TaxID=307937 RepID=A0A9P9JL61_9HYPO|nr:hypothetical protein EDB81DRAFT_774688 [Dactylonectria macrodidyma]